MEAVRVPVSAGLVTRERKTHQQFRIELKGASYTLPHACIFHVDGHRYDDQGGFRESTYFSLRTEARIVQGSPNHFAEC